MAAPLPQFYFTEVDPDYSIKGSRDPLGLQVLWQAQGRQLIPYLSTVSGSVTDFQILSLGYFLYGKEPDNAFIPFFIRFEQLMAYARYEMGDVHFNGVGRVRTRMREGRRYLSISNRPADELLSNQRAYGIWSKYNRPCREIGYRNDPRFQSIYEKKLSNLPQKAAFDKLLQQLTSKESIKVDIEMLLIAQPLLKMYKAERQFYDEHLLHVARPNPHQNQLYYYLQDIPPSNFALFPFLNAFKTTPYAQEEALQVILTEIEATEKIICPVHRIFRYLQTKPLWTRQEIEGDAYLQQCRFNTTHTFAANSEENKIKNAFALSLQKEPWALVEDLVKRNKEVTAWRGGAPWLAITGDVLEIHHADGGYYNPDFDPNTHNDFNYFIDTYFRLFQQIVS